jgi:hypothetical protein
MLMSLALSLGLIPSSWSRDRGPIFDAGSIAVHPAPPIAREMISWSVTRYEQAGLGLPPTDVFFHDGRDGCDGYLGTTVVGRIDLCVRLAMEPGPQRIVLHELAHAWVFANFDAARQASLLEMRGLTSWAGRGVPWKEQGREQAAEIVAWGLGDGTMLPMIEGDVEHRALSEAFRLLTGVDPPE